MNDIEQVLETKSVSEADRYLHAFLQDGGGEEPASERTRAGARTGLVHSTLRWALSDERGARFLWEALRDHGGGTSDRDRFVEDLWRAIREGGLQSFRSEFIEPNGLGPAYRRRLFEWFLSRFHLAAALRIYLGRRAVRLLLGWLVVVPALLGLLLLVAKQPPQLCALSALLLGCLLVAGAGRLARVPWRAYAQLLLPRLGVAVAIGYLFVASSAELLGVLLSWDEGPFWHVVALIFLLAGVLAFVAAHCAQRIHPCPPPRQLAARAVTVLAAAAVYALVELVVFRPLLFSESLLEAAAASPPRSHQAALIYGVALALGVVLELAWEDRPLTQPL